ncbi:hypothetical protein N7535_007686 [Penicillium sp. DV-2018c]|nr:hypothetical protein N7461_003717 [Penicillium sp. DV-2018c]KAJ5566048.1 hypothetical protein N7535_007686 [Penicillium sp. DV-2018c]
MPPIRGQNPRELVGHVGRKLLTIKAIKMAGLPRLLQLLALSRVNSDWLISMDNRGAALTIAMSRDIANILLQTCRGQPPVIPPTQFHLADIYCELLGCAKLAKSLLPDDVDSGTAEAHAKPAIETIQASDTPASRGSHQFKTA